MATKAFDQTADVYPIWGTCQGFEQLAYLSNGGKDPRSPCNADIVSFALNFTSDFEKSRIGNAMPTAIKDILANEEVTFNYHHFCITPATMSESPMKEFWTPLATNQDVHGIEFVSLMESKKYPFYGSQFHPEKNIFEWSLNYPSVPHSRHAILSAAFFADFFVNECRKSHHQFPNEAEEEQHLIYNYNPLYTGKAEVNFSLQQTYMFKNEDMGSGSQTSSPVALLLLPLLVGVACTLVNQF